jgi:4-oxalocrotonate tautomerase
MGGLLMPIITIEAGKMNVGQKEALIQEITKIASGILELPEQSFIVLLKENDNHNVGSGGKMLSKLIAERNQ